MRLLIVLLLATLAVKVLAEPLPNPARVFRYQVADEAKDHTSEKDTELNTKTDDSSGRLFLRKFFFKNLFGQNQKPPIIPIIITGPNNADATKIDTLTSTDITSPTATTTILDPVPPNLDPADTATPITNAPADPVDTATPTDPTRRFELYGSTEEDADTVEAFAENNDEFIVSGVKPIYTSSSNGHRAPARINLRLRGGISNQVITISVPAKYRGYFKNGQRVVLEGHKARARPAKRRVIRRRKNRRRNNKNKKNKRHQYITV